MLNTLGRVHINVHLRSPPGSEKSALIKGNNVLNLEVVTTNGAVTHHSTVRENHLRFLGGIKYESVPFTRQALLKRHIYESLYYDSSLPGKWD